MRDSIRKIASLCLAMAMILSTLAMPAFAEERAVHLCLYNRYIRSDTERTPTYHDNDTHKYETTHYYACDCGTIDDSTVTYRYEAHTARGTGTLEYTITDDWTGAVVYYVSYACKDCEGRFIVEEY